MEIQMPTTSRRAALNALTEKDTFEICVALQLHMGVISKSITESKNTEYWQPKLDAAKAAYERVMNIRVAI